MSEHTISNADIEALFSGEAIVLDGSKAMDLENKNTSLPETTRENVSLKGVQFSLNCFLGDIW